jgi:hypothetical protein
MFPKSCSLQRPLGDGVGVFLRYKQAGVAEDRRLSSQFGQNFPILLTFAVLAP